MGQLIITFHWANVHRQQTVLGPQGSVHLFTHFTVIAFTSTVKNFRIIALGFFDGHVFCMIL